MKLPDTNTAVELIRDSPGVAARFEAEPAISGTSTVTAAELYRGRAVG
jgi:predicted nucleic acid-binding protein